MKATVASLALAALPCLAGAPAASAEETGIKVPSGQKITPVEILWEKHFVGQEEQTWVILRFLAPEIAKDGGSVDFEQAAEDMEHICESIGLPLAKMFGPGIDQVMVTLMERQVERGERAMGVTQYMSAYEVRQGACQWR